MVEMNFAAFVVKDPSLGPYVEYHRGFCEYKRRPVMWVSMKVTRIDSAGLLFLVVIVSSVRIEMPICGVALSDGCGRGK